MSEPDARPLLRIVSGNPSTEDVAVLTAVMTAAGGEDEPVAEPRRGRWNDPAMLTRRTLRAGPGAWQAALR